MNRASKINQVLKLRELANSEYKLGNNAAGRAAMTKAAELMHAHSITRAELAQAANGNGQPAATSSRHAGQPASGIKTKHVEIKFTNGKVTVNGKTVRSEQEAVHILAEDFFSEFMKHFFG